VLFPSWLAYCAQQYQSSSFFEVSFSRKKAQNYYVLFMANAVWPMLFPKLLIFPAGTPIIFAA
jgi:hypothetical protein